MSVAVYQSTQPNIPEDFSLQFKRNLNPGNAHCCLLTKRLYLRVLFKRLEVKSMYELRVGFVLCGCGTWSVILRDAHRHTRIGFYEDISA